MRINSALLLILLGLMAAVPVAYAGEVTVTVTIAQAQVAGVEIRPRPDRRGRPGETLTYRFRVQNTGSGTDRFTLAATSSLEWPFVLPGGTLTDFLTTPPGPDSRTTVEVQITIPAGETVGAQDVLMLTVTSEFDPGVSADTSVTSTVAKPRGGGPP